MNLPAMCNLHYDDCTVNFFNSKLDEYKLNSKFWIENNATNTINGIQTNNLLEIADDEFLNKVNLLKDKLIEHCGIQLQYHWIHFIEYDRGGYQGLHNHDHNEDLSLIIYLNDCDDGETIFYLNEKRNVTVSVKPTFGDAVLFLSSINHMGRTCSSNKRVMVCGLKLT